MPTQPPATRRGREALDRAHPDDAHRQPAAAADLIEALQRRDRGEVRRRRPSTRRCATRSPTIVQPAGRRRHRPSSTTARRASSATRRTSRSASTGFGGTAGATRPMPDATRLPRVRRSATSGGNVDFATPGLHRPGRLRATSTPFEADIANLQGRGRRASTSQDVFMSAASPGVIALFLQNQHYPTARGVLFGARRRR